MITLRPYQTEAAHQMARLLMDHRIAYLRGEVRTGKTLTAFETARQPAVMGWPTPSGNPW